MSYLNFLLIFLIPLLTLNAFLFYKTKGKEKKYSLLGITLLAVLAFVYTTPWDNYLVANEVWWYGKNRVLGTVGYVPIEEYMFFILQTYMTGFFTYLLWNKEQQLITDKKIKPNRVLKIVCLSLLLGAEIISLYMLTTTKGFYLGLILSWCLPVVIIQLLFGFNYIKDHLKVFFHAFFWPSLYLCLADSFAISNGIWSISENYTLGLKFGSLPIEEAVFFFATNIMVTLGLLLFLYMKKDMAFKLKQLKHS
jgi:putative membrane protein